MNPETENDSFVQKANIKIIETEKKNIKKILGNNCKNIFYLPFAFGKLSKKTTGLDLVIISKFHRLDDISHKIKTLGYTLISEKNNIFSIKKDNVIISLYIVSYGEENYYIFNDFKQYLSVNPQKEKEYVNLKNNLISSFSSLTTYEDSKFNYIKRVSREAVYWKILGEKINITTFQEDKNYIYEIKGVQYRLNIGLSDIKTHGLKIMTYIMGVKKTVHKFSGKVIAVIEENNKILLIAAPVNKIYYEPDIKKAIGQAINLSSAKLVCLYEKSCGAVVYKKEKNKILYLLIKNRSKNIGFPKGHVEEDENELDTAEREIMEETNVKVKIDKNFRISYNYNINFFIRKQAVYYVAEIIDGTIKIPENEILSYHLVPFDEAYLLLTHPNEKKILKNANQYINTKNNKGKTYVFR